MKKLLTLMLSLLAFPASAQNWCTPYLDCQPLATQVVPGNLATHLFWFTRSPSGGIRVNGFSCPKALCDTQLFATVANDVLTGKRTASQASTERIKFNCDYSTWAPVTGEHPVCTERKALFVAKHTYWLAGIPFKIEPWRVKANGTVATRPAYTLANGVRGTREVARATVGAPCDATKPTLASGKDLWAEFGTPGVVALCAKAVP
jgi:hypothetical protein